MSNTCSHNVRLSGLAENLEKFYERIKDLRSQTTGIMWPFSIDKGLYHIIFELEVDIEDWGSESMFIHSKDYESGYFSMEFVCSSDVEPSFSFWQKVSKHFDLVVEISYFDLDSDLHCRIIFDYGLVIIDEKITNLEYLYFNDRESFWIECNNDDWSSIDEILSKLESISIYLDDDEMKKIKEIFENK